MPDQLRSRCCWKEYQQLLLKKRPTRNPHLVGAELELVAREAVRQTQGHGAQIRACHAAAGCNGQDACQTGCVHGRGGETWCKNSSLLMQVPIKRMFSMPHLMRPCSWLLMPRVSSSTPLLQASWACTSQTLDNVHDATCGCECTPCNHELQRLEMPNALVVVRC